MLKKYGLLSFMVIFSFSALAKKDLPKANPSRSMVEKALAENAVFKCSSNTTLESQADGKKLDQILWRSCSKQIDALSKWYKPKEKEQRAKRLIGNGKRSALSHRRFL